MHLPRKLPCQIWTILTFLSASDGPCRVSLSLNAVARSSPVASTATKENNAQRWNTPADFDLEPVGI
jgi:hypothetical protein